MNLKDVRCEEDVDWIQLAQDKVQWRALVNLRVPLRAGNLLAS
jgi:hypothetical protein